MKTLITGAAGFIGFHLAKHLSEQGKELLLLDNLHRGNIDNEFNHLIEKDNVNFMNMDLTDYNSFSSINDEVSEIYHLAAINGTKNFYSIPDQVLKVNILSTLNILDWVKDKPQIKVLFSSTSEVYAGSIKYGLSTVPTNESTPLCIDDISNVRWSYGASKMLSENAFFCYNKLYNVNFSIIRYHNIYGPRMGFDHVVPEIINRIYLGESPLKIYGGDQTRAFCFVDDAIRATQLVMEKEETNGKIVHIGNSDEEIKIMDLARTIIKLSGFNVNIIKSDPPLGSINKRCPDISLLKSFGFHPKTNLQEGLNIFLNWYNSDFINNK